ncbi:MAG TPA: deoxyribose-phosphate aldolase [Flavisolibacter sp.]|jgi:deoxyribose-phosphate aldolase|nr:deoxyribose-phosphate aldolase [Flavisolibacter sp.]
MSIAGFIDHTILKNTTSAIDIERLCTEAKQYRFASVCLPPYYVSDAKQILGQAIAITTVIGFPFGYSTFQSKVKETEIALADGANEIDMVMNLSAFKNNDIAYLEQEVDAISNVTREKNAVLKVIIESGILTEEEIIKCCHLYKHFPVDFLKTSTGYADKGASIEAVQIMRKNLPENIKIKASGGIKTYKFASDLIKAGASRLGCSASVAIVNEEIAANVNG